jgi:hypothetical protein
MSEESEEIAHATAVRVLHRELVDSSGLPAGTVSQDDTLTYRLRLRFDEPVHSPVVQFRVYGQDGMGLYQVETRIGDRWRMFEPGEVAEVEVTFEPRFGGGGTFRAAVVVSSVDTSVTYVHDLDGITFFVQPRIGVVGVCDLQARIAVDDEDRTNDRSLRFHAGAAEGEGA